MEAHTRLAEPVLALLDAEFTMSDLKYAIDSVPAEARAPTLFNEMADNMLWLAHSNYHLDFSPDTALSERVIFPVSENESRGIEDARFVRFTHPDGRVDLLRDVLGVQRLSRPAAAHRDDATFAISRSTRSTGACVQNKGMALFPRKVGDDFVMAARLDGENIFLLRSDNIHFWNESTLIHRPKHGGSSSSSATADRRSRPTRVGSS